jgi:uncharacterized protein YbjQ (UPF0145 family)
MIITTSSTIAGHEIINYLEPITSHLVAGTDVFSDMAAGFTDFFGGRSASYQKQISALYKDAITELKIKAIKLNAHAVIGLHIDLDEISGKGKSMFMITAIGSPVVFKADIKESFMQAEFVSLESITLLKQRHLIINKFSNTNSVIVQDEDWDFIINNSVEELLPNLVQRYSRLEESNPTTIKILDNISRLVETFENTDILYNLIESTESFKISHAYVSLINSNKLLNLNKVLSFLNSDNFDLKKIALSLVFTTKLFYNRDDINVYQNIKTKIEEAFPARGKIVFKKSLLSKEKEMWECECGRVNELNTSCSECAKNIYGFLSSERKPADAIEKINEQVALINEALHIEK